MLEGMRLRRARPPNLEAQIHDYGSHVKPSLNAVRVKNVDSREFLEFGIQVVLKGRDHAMKSAHPEISSAEIHSPKKQKLEDYKAK